MKKSLIFIALCGFTLVGSAQNQDSTTLERKNVVKFLPVNIPFQSISFEFERMINGKNSWILGVGLPNQASVIGKYGYTPGPDLKTAEFGTMHIRAAYRHYTGKRNLPKGFYLEPYLKYQKIKGNASVESTDILDLYKGSVDVNFHTMNMGFQMGAQFLISKRVSVDLYFLGLEAGLLSGNLTALSDQLADAENLKANIEDAINELPSFIGKKLTVTQSADKKQINVNSSSAPYPWFRGGISIGIAF
jgi:hypothetical protein